MKTINVELAFRPRCYYCNRRLGSVDGYERTTTPKPTRLSQETTDNKYYRLEKQDMYWEREVKADFEWK